MHKETIIVRIEKWAHGFAAVRYIDHVPYIITRNWQSAIVLYQYLVCDCQIDPSRIEIEQ